MRVHQILVPIKVTQAACVSHPQLQHLAISVFVLLATVVMILACIKMRACHRLVIKMETPVLFALILFLQRLATLAIAHLHMLEHNVVLLVRFAMAIFATPTTTLVPFVSPPRIVHLVILATVHLDSLVPLYVHWCLVHPTVTIIRSVRVVMGMLVQSSGMELRLLVLVQCKD